MSLGFRKSLFVLPGFLLFPVILSVVIVLYSAYRSIPADLSTTPPSDTREGKWAHDLEVVIQVLSTRHADPFYVADEAEWLASAAALRDDLAVLSDAEITLRLMQLVGKLRDGHTGIALTGLWEALADHQYPITLAQFEDGLFVVRAAYEAESAIGASLVAVNGVDIEEIASRLEDTLYYDSGNSYGRSTSIEGLFTRPARLYLAGIVTELERATFTFRTPEGAVLELTLNAYESIPSGDFKLGRLPQIPLYRTHESDDKDVWFSHLPEHRAVYLQYNDAEVDFFEFTTTSTQALQVALKENAEKFIVDVRNNRGGSDVPFLLFDHRLRQTSLDIYGIMSRYTFSSGFSAIIDLRLSGATIVGQPAGTRPNFFGNVRVTTLPHSGLTLVYPTTLGLAKVQPYGDAPVFMPDVPVALTSAEFFAGRDPYLEAILGD